MTTVQEDFSNPRTAFAKRLSGLLAEKKITQKQFASELELRPSSVSDYMKGNMLPSVEQLVGIAEYFHVTTDYLLGLSDIRAHENFSLEKEFCDKYSVSEKCLEYIARHRLLLDFIAAGQSDIDILSFLTKYLRAPIVDETVFNKAVIASEISVDSGFTIEPTETNTGYGWNEIIRQCIFRELSLSIEELYKDFHRCDM